MKDYIRTFERDGVTVVTEVRNGERLPTRYVRDGQSATPPKKEPRRIESKRRAKAAKSAPPPPTNRADCLHILEATGDSVEQKNCGCPGNKMTSVWECELFGRVAPFAKGDPVDGVRACQKCGAYEKPLPLAPPAE